jgi:histidine ammonia-lyase
MALEYTAHDAAGELTTLAAPTLVAATLSHGVENHASFAPLAARNAARAVACLYVVVACELVAAVRALRMRGAAPAGAGTLAIFQRIAPALPSEMADRPLTTDIATAVQQLRSGVLR